jgi:hypothetical protein
MALPTSFPPTSTSNSSSPQLTPTDTQCLSSDLKSQLTFGGNSLQRHPDLWFDDGSVVLCAENTLFRVHISQLSRHSVCFRDMFAMPQPKSDLGKSLPCAQIGDGKEDVFYLKEYDNCPVVHLHDAAEDVGNLLTALYDGPYVSQLGTRRIHP